MNNIWCWLIIIGIFISLITGKINNLGNIMIDSSTKAFEIFFQTGILILFWGGLFQIAIDSGMVKRFSNFLKKPLRKIYPELDFESKAYELICSNMVANMLGLGAAATPMGLAAFKEMAKDTKNGIPNRSMLTFIAINCSSLTLIPTTIISLRKLNGGSTNINVILMMIIATSISTFLAILLDRIFYKRSKV